MGAVAAMGKLCGAGRFNGRPRRRIRWGRLRFSVPPHFALLWIEPCPTVSKRIPAELRVRPYGFSVDEMRQPGGAARERGFVLARIQQRGGNMLFTLSHFTNSLSYFTNTRFPRRRFCPIISGASRSFSGLAFSAGAFGFRVSGLPSRGFCEGTTRTRCYMIFRYRLISLLAASLFAKTPSTRHSKNAESVQAQPAPERIAEIQAALKAHGYEPGDTWEETQEVCRKIADEHMWQTDHAPDARVLILLGLGGPHSDPAVAQMQGDRLDNDQRTDAAHKSEGAEAYAPTPVAPSVLSPVPSARHSSVPAANSKTLAAASTPVASVRANVKAPTRRHVRKTTLVRSKSAPKKKLTTRNTSQNKRLHPA